MLNDLLTLLLVIAAGALAIMGTIANYARKKTSRLQAELDAQTTARELDRAIARARETASHEAQTRWQETERSLDEGKRNQLERP